MIIYRILIIFVFLGCFNGNKKINDRYANLEKFQNKDRLANLESNVLILKAILFRKYKEYEKSQQIFDKLFKETREVEYKFWELVTSLEQKLSNKKIKELEDLLKKNFLNHKTKIDIFLNLCKKHKMDNKIYKFITFLNKKKIIILNSSLFIDSYLKLKKFDEVIKILNILYKKNNNIQYLIQISYIYIEQKKIDKAIDLLEKNNVIFNRVISQVLSEIYKKYYSKKIEKRVNLYLKIYKDKQNKNISLEILKIYILNNNIQKAINFLEENPIDNELLFKLYSYLGNTKKAKILSNNMFKQTNDNRWLHQYISILYDEIFIKNAVIKKDNKTLKIITDGLKYLISKDERAQYLNFYGFILIDVEIDIEEGIRMVQKSLIKDKNNIYYLDSLAWGYFKSKKCNKAKLIMNKIFKIYENLNEELILLHKEKIINCNK